MIIKYKAYWFEDKIFTLVDTIMFLQGGIMVEDGCCHKGWNDKDCKLIPCTGLTDKNGKEIYEGDIYHQGDKNIRYQVVWHDTGFMGKQMGSSSYAGLQYWKDKIEVVSNIYEVAP